MYSRIDLDSHSSSQQFNYNPNAIYKNISNVCEVRNIEDILKMVETINKNYSLVIGQVSNIE